MKTALIISLFLNVVFVVRILLMWLKIERISAHIRMQSEALKGSVDANLPPGNGLPGGDLKE